MINLFEEKSKYVLQEGTEDNPIFNVSSDEDVKILVSWNVKNYKKVTINLQGTGIISILEVGEKFSPSVELNIKNGTTVRHSIASFGNNATSNYVVNMEENASYQGALADFTTGTNRFDYVCNLNGTMARATWNLASLSCKEDNKTFYVSFYHYAKHTYAKMENYGVCEDNASLNFFGTSSIEKGAKASATHQSAKVMVFDPTCKAKASPKLCIAENDVEASHAAVVGQINEDHIFYLTSRGIPEEQAKKLITLGYLNPILRFFDEESIVEEIKTNIEGRF